MAESKSAALPLGYAPNTICALHRVAKVARNIVAAPWGCNRPLWGRVLATGHIERLRGCLTTGLGQPWPIAVRCPTRLCCTAHGYDADGRSDKATMQKKVQSGIAVCLGLAFAWVLPAAALDCAARWLGDTEVAICRDPQLSRSEDQIMRRIAGLAQRV